MDPDANLKEMRELYQKMRKYENLLVARSVIQDDSMRLIELLEAMDEWLSKGGFLPEDWKESWSADNWFRK